MAAPPAKTIFELNRYVRRVTPQAAEAPALLVLPAGRLTFDDWRKQVPKALWARAAAREMRVVFDASGEGKQHEAARSFQIHAFLAARRISPKQAVYITQDRGYAADYESWRVAAGGGPGIKIVQADYFARRFFLDLEEHGAETFDRRLESFRRRGAHRARRLITLNLSPRESKIYFLLRLMREGLWDTAFASFGGMGMNKRGKSVVYRRWEQEIADLAPEVARLEAMGRFLLDRADDHTNPAYRTPIYDADMPEYGESWFTVVTETEMLDRPNRITEKPFKALVNFHPLIVLGNPHALDLIREYGFRTFEGFFDETYDHEMDAGRRFEQVFQQVASLCRAEEPELARRTAAVEEALVHNARWGLTRLPRVIRKERDLALLEAVLT